MKNPGVYKTGGQSNDIENNVIRDRSGDPKYYVRYPRMVWAKAQNTSEITLWLVLKQIAGERGECWVSTNNLAKLAMMSVSMVQRSRKALLAAGVIEGRLIGKKGNKVWYITIPNLWEENTRWAEAHLPIKDRAEFKSQQGNLSNVEGTPSTEYRGPPVQSTDKEDLYKNSQKSKTKRTSPDEYISPGTHSVFSLTKKSLKTEENVIIDGVSYRY